MLHLTGVLKRIYYCITLEAMCLWHKMTKAFSALSSPPIPQGCDAIHGRVAPCLIQTPVH